MNWKIPRPRGYWSSIRSTRNLVGWGVGVLFLTAIGSLGLSIYAFTRGFGELKRSVTPAQWMEISYCGVPIRERNLKHFGTETEPLWFLGDRGLELLKQRIDRDLGVGPEIYSLKEIILTEEGSDALISDSVNGTYYPGTSQIIINTSPLVNIFSNRGQAPDHSFLETKVELLFQTLYHEYRHHEANAWLMNLEIDDLTWVSKEIYSQPNVVQPWNQYFLGKFKELLRYDVPTPLYGEPYIYDNFISNQPLLDTIKLKQNNRAKTVRVKSIGTVYDSKTLFEIANSSERDFSKIWEGFERNEGYAFSPAYPDWEWAPINPENASERISYLFSIHELFARKYMQLTMPFRERDLVLRSGTWQSPYDDRHQNLTLYLRDTLMYSEGFQQNDVYLNDRPFADQSTSSGLINLWREHNGHFNSADLALIWHENTARNLSNVKGGIVRVPMKSDEEVDRIKFAGWLDPTQTDYNYVGYLKEDGSFRAIPIIKHPRPYDYHALTHLASDVRSIYSSVDSHTFYVTNGERDGWLHGPELVGKILYFAKDEFGQDLKALESLRRSQTGPVWTKKFSNPQRAKKVGRTYQAVLSADQKSVQISLLNNA